MLNLLGLISGLLLAFCALPQAIKSVIDGHSDGISHGMLWMWYMGEIGMLTYIVIKYGASDLWLLLNYSANVIIISIIFKYKYWEKV